MDTIVTHAQADYSVWNSKPPPNSAPNIGTVGLPTSNGELNLHRVKFASQVTNNLPIQIRPSAVLQNSHRYGSFYDDYYNRIHVTPRSIEIGNLLSNQIRTVEIWSAYPTPQTLNTITSIGATGITFGAVARVPITFGALQSTEYEIDVSINGPPVISANYTLQFTNDSIRLDLSGRRIVVWPFMPQTRHRESLEWQTDIIGAFSSEQRLALRAAPRQSFSYTFQLDNQQFSRAKAILNQWAHRVFGIPVWSSLTKVGRLESGATQILLDTAYADYRVDDVLLIWQSDSEFIAAETQAILADRIELKIPLSVSFENAYVAPMRFARTLNGVNFRRNSNPYIVANGEFSVTQNKSVSASNYPTYRGKDVLPNRTVIASSLRETIRRDVDVFDNDSGQIEVDITTDYPYFSQVITFDTLDRQQRWQARQWLDSLRGRQKSFWLPSWNNDFKLLADANQSNNTLRCAAIGYSIYYDVTDILIRNKNGDTRYNRILSASLDSNGDEILLLENPIGIDLSPTNIDLICFMSHVRLNADRVQINHGDSGRATASIAVTEIPQ